jgi:hypothetical protein
MYVFEQQQWYILVDVCAVSVLWYFVQFCDTQAIYFQRVPVLPEQTWLARSRTLKRRTGTTNPFSHFSTLIFLNTKYPV